MSESPSLSSLPAKYPQADGWAFTRSVENPTFTFYWAVENFADLEQETGEYIASPTFTMPTATQKTKWCIHLFPNGVFEEYSSHVGIFLVNMTQKKVEGRTKFKIFLMNNQNKEALYRVSSYSFGKSDYGDDDKDDDEDDDEWGWKNFIERSKLMNKKENYLDGENMVIKCTIQIVEVRSLKEERVDIEIPENQICDDLSGLLESRRFSDLKINVDGQEFNAHKAILSARCSVFSAMFSHPLKEGLESRIDIMDMKKEVFEEMLTFIYTGKASNMTNPDWCSEWVDELLTAADKYDLQRLKLMCEAKLASTLSVENVSKCLMLASLHSAKYLKKKAITYVNSHSAEVIRTEGWKELVSRCPRAAVEIFEALH